MPFIIGLTGKKNSGKSTIATYLQNKYGFVELTFAEPLKMACIDIFDLSHNQVFGEQSDKETIDTFWDTTPRKILQQVGSAIRALEPPLNSVWIRNLKKRINALIANNPDVCIVVSDVRYGDEAQMLKEFGTKLVQIIRPNDHYDDHESENQLILTRWSILNSSTITNLHQNVEQLLDQIS